MTDEIEETAPDVTDTVGDGAEAGPPAEEEEEEKPE